jgi:hypothetical protein
MIAVSTHDDVLPPDTEARIGQFAELMATAIANAEARARWLGWLTNRRRFGEWRRSSRTVLIPAQSSTP